MMIDNWNRWLLVLVTVVPVAWSLAFLGQVEAQVGVENFPKIDANQDWPWWRGATRDGHSTSTKVPDQLDPNTNLDWSVPIPGRGHGSPTVVGKRVYLLTAEEKSQKHAIVALDRDTGKTIWERVINEGGFPKKNHPKNTEASPSIACDGERLYVSVFHHLAVWGVALNLNGEQVWTSKLGDFNPKMYEYGYAPSPTLYGGNVIFVMEYDGPSAIVALDRASGKEAWNTKRKESISFSSPVVTSYKGQDYLLLSGVDTVNAYDPRNGKLLWSTPGTTMATCGTMVWDDGIVFASGGYPKAETIALEIATGKALWQNKQKAYEQSMVATSGHLYSLTDSGVLYCWDGRTGQEKWKQRLAGPVSASGVLAGNKIYWANEAGQLWVFEANPEKYVELSKNQIGDESFASPAICGNQIFLRVAKNENGKRQEYMMRFSSR